jgi:hypothetical protein
VVVSAISRGFGLGRRGRAHLLRCPTADGDRDRQLPAPNAARIFDAEIVDDEELPLLIGVETIEGAQIRLEAPFRHRKRELVGEFVTVRRSIEGARLEPAALQPLAVRELIAGLVVQRDSQIRDVVQTTGIADDQHADIAFDEEEVHIVRALAAEVFQRQIDIRDPAPLEILDAQL